MIPLEECVAVLLCAGLSRRFGSDNKLLAPLNGKPLAAYAAELCARVPFAHKVAVVPRGEPLLNALLLNCRFELIVNANPELGKNSSLRLGLASALAWRTRGVLVLLGDMPYVDAAHLNALSAAADDERAAISSVGNVASPPTLIPTKVARLALDRADQSVRASLGHPARVAAPASLLADYDIPEQFGAAESPH